MKSLVLDGLEDYARAHTSAPAPLYERLREETFRATALPQMQVGHLEGRLLKMLTQLTGARCAVEVGTFTGYSGLCIAEGLGQGGVLHTFDIDPVATAIARRYWDEAPWAAGKIQLHLGDARTLLPSVIDALAQPAVPYPIDFAFIDADKTGYQTYWDLIVARLRPGGLVAVDNVLWSGSVLAPATEDADAIVAFNRHAAADARVETMLLTVRDGLLLARKKG